MLALFRIFTLFIQASLINELHTLKLLSTNLLSEVGGVGDIGGRTTLFNIIYKLYENNHEYILVILMIYKKIFITKINI